MLNVSASTVNFMCSNKFLGIFPQSKILFGDISENVLKKQRDKESEAYRSTNIYYKRQFS